MAKKARTPAGWMDLLGGDAVNTRIVKHRLDLHLAAMREVGFEVDTEPTKTGYRVIIIRSPNDKPKRPHLRGSQMNEINRDEVETFIELRGVYDGWSIAKMKDGSYVNRWHPDDSRYRPTEDFIELLEEEE